MSTPQPLDRLIEILDQLTDFSHFDDCKAYGKEPDADVEDRDSEIDDNPSDFLEHCNCGLKDLFEAWEIAKSLRAPSPVSRDGAEPAPLAGAPQAPAALEALRAVFYHPFQTVSPADKVDDLIRRENEALYWRVSAMLGGPEAGSPGGVSREGRTAGVREWLVVGQHMPEGYWIVQGPPIGPDKFIVREAAPSPSPEGPGQEGAAGK